MNGLSMETFVRISRRGALLGAVASGPIACRSGGRSEPDRGGSVAATGSAVPAGMGVSAAASATGDGAADWGGLEVVSATRMRDDERGGVAVVLLHGWGAQGDDLVPLGRALMRPGSRFFMPAAPLPEVGGGRAWWHLNANDRPVHAWNDEIPAGFRPHPQVSAVRAAIQTVLRTIHDRYAPDTLVIAGFSQGAMLSLDVALAAEPPVDRVAALSGVLVADSLAALKAPRTSRPRVFASHGRQDPILPFAAGESAKNMLTQHGYDVAWHPFEGGHQIPPAVVQALGAFLFASN